MPIAHIAVPMKWTSIHLPYLLRPVLRAITSVPGSLYTFNDQVQLGTVHPEIPRTPTGCYQVYQKHPKDQSAGFGLPVICLIFSVRMPAPPRPPPTVPVTLASSLLNGPRRFLCAPLSLLRRSIALFFAR